MEEDSVFKAGIKQELILLTSKGKTMIINANDGIMPYPGLAADQEKNA